MSVRSSRQVEDKARSSGGEEDLFVEMEQSKGNVTFRDESKAPVKGKVATKEIKKESLEQKGIYIATEVIPGDNCLPGTRINDKIPSDVHHSERLLVNTIEESYPVTFARITWLKFHKKKSTKILATIFPLKFPGRHVARDTVSTNHECLSEVIRG
ncbi:hypothetical protein Tco_0163585 [Tanacetum coccineum]